MSKYAPGAVYIQIMILEHIELRILPQIIHASGAAVKRGGLGPDWPIPGSAPVVVGGGWRVVAAPLFFFFFFFFWGGHWKGKVCFGGWGGALKFYPDILFLLYFGYGYWLSWFGAFMAGGANCPHACRPLVPLLFKRVKYRIVSNKRPPNSFSNKTR